MKTLVRLLSKATVWVLLLVVRCYQIVLAPMLGNCCRFTPSCSNYCMEALRVHGVFKGLWLTVARLARCRPGGPCGYDPVPPRKESL